MKRKYSFSEIVKFSGSTCKPFDGKKEYISTGCIHENSISGQEVETVDYKTKPSRANLQVETGDIIFAKMQGTKKTLQINNELSEKIFSTGFCAVKPKDGVITTKCLYYLLNSSLFLKEKDKNCSGATQKAINSSGFKNIKLNVPDFNFQKNIEKQLDNLTMAIEDKKMEIQRLDSLIKARFVEMFGDRYTNDKKWCTKELGECISFSNGKAHEQVVDEDGEYILVTSKAIASDFSDVRKTNSLLFPLHMDDIVMVMSDVPNGRALAKCKLIDKDDKYTLNQRICRLNKYDFNPVFLLYLLNRHPYFLSFNDGNGQTNLRKNDILKCELIRPPIELQKQFATFANQVDKSKFALRNKLAMRNFYVCLIHDRIMHSGIDL